MSSSNRRFGRLGRIFSRRERVEPSGIINSDTYAHVTAFRDLRSEIDFDQIDLDEYEDITENEYEPFRSEYDIREWHRAQNRKYVPQSGEYSAPENKKYLVTMATARNLSKDGDVDFNKVDAFWTGVRGCNFYLANEWNLERNIEHEVWFELVPEPGNPYDSHAVAVHLEGKRLGYLSANLASSNYWRVRQLNSCGHRAITPGTYKCRFDPRLEMLTPSTVRISMPTFRTWDEFLPSREVQEAEFAYLWESIGESSREMVRNEGFEVTAITTELFVRFQQCAPTLGLPTISVPGAVPWIVERLLRETKRGEKEAIITRRNDSIVEKYIHGESKQSIADQIGISPSTVSRVLKKEGINLNRKY